MPRRATLIAVVAAACVGCGQQAASNPTGPRAVNSSSTSASVDAIPQGHPQAVEPVAGAAAKINPASAPATAGVSVEPAGASSSLPAPQPVSEIRRELAQSGMNASANQATLTSDGLAVAPIAAPAVVQDVIAAGNEIARLPYRYGGGHETFQDTAYDCSGSISYVFAAAHLLDRTVVSGDLENWGDPGPGKWITVFANAGHTFMYVAGLRFDTVALAETGSRWSDRSADEPDIKTFAVRHPPGL
jgi:cell wall-associated NlpC family hydrolase